MNGDLPNINPAKLIKNIKWIILGLAAFIFLVSGFFQIEPEEVGIILRFGKYVRTVNPGLNFKIPFGVESVEKVPVERQKKAEFGFRTLKAGIRSQYSKGNFKEESLMLTGDLNAAEVEWIVQYRIADPFKYLFRVRNPEKTFRDMNEAVMRQVIGDRAINEVITIGRQEIADEVKVKLQLLCEQYETGLKVDQVVLQNVTPPEQVKASFNEVNEAQQEKERMINEAMSEYNKVVPRAKGEALQTIEEAKGYALERVNEAKGEAAKFTSVFREYMKAPEVTRQRIYLETMNDIYTKVDRKIISDKDFTGILPFFNTEKALKQEVENE
ncbi:FtsH protease activity modulator HflK [Spirochaetota bacterium]